MNRKQRRAAAKRNKNKLHKQSLGRQFTDVPMRTAPGGNTVDATLPELGDMVLAKSGVNVVEFCMENRLDKLTKPTTIRELAESLDHVPFLEYMWNKYPDKCAVYLATEFDEPFELTDYYYNAFSNVDIVDFAKLIKFSEVNAKYAATSTRIQEEAAYVDSQIAYGIYQNWKKYKQVYEFSDNVCKELSHTDTPVLTKATLEALPYDTFYMDLSNWPGDNEIDGVFIHWNKNDFFKEERGYCLWTIFVSKDLTPMGAAACEVCEDESSAIPEQCKSLIAPVVLALNYLSSVKPDIDSSKELRIIKGTHKSRESNWNGVGYHIASDYNPKSYSTVKYVYDKDHVSSVRKPMRPHMRRGHWRTRNGKTVWVRPCFINCNDASELPVFAHTVK